MFTFSDESSFLPIPKKGWPCFKRETSGNQILQPLALPYTHNQLSDQLMKQFQHTDPLSESLGQVTQEPRQPEKISLCPL
ncbi:hypothetical protein TNCV_3172081 [Trichonephila clavipes]|nr:hypothetical protein TNCV_3172081 [Trichonephila clavipes]